MQFRKFVELSRSEASKGRAGNSCQTAAAASGVVGRKIGSSCGKSGPPASPAAAAAADTHTSCSGLVREENKAGNP